MTMPESSQNKREYVSLPPLNLRQQHGAPVTPATTPELKRIEDVEDLQRQLTKDPLGALPSFTFSGCYNGTPKKFDIPVYNGPY